MGGRSGRVRLSSRQLSSMFSTRFGFLKKYYVIALCFFELMYRSDDITEDSIQCRGGCGSMIIASSISVETTEMEIKGQEDAYNAVSKEVF